MAINQAQRATRTQRGPIGLGSWQDAAAGGARYGELTWNVRVPIMTALVLCVDHNRSGSLVRRPFVDEHISIVFVNGLLESIGMGDKQVDHCQCTIIQCIHQQRIVG